MSQANYIEKIEKEKQQLHNKARNIAKMEKMEEEMLKKL